MFMITSFVAYDTDLGMKVAIKPNGPAEAEIYTKAVIHVDLNMSR